jgi:hypothetical protein
MLFYLERVILYDPLLLFATACHGNNRLLLHCELLRWRSPPNVHGLEKRTIEPNVVPEIAAYSWIRNFGVSSAALFGLK